MAYESFYIFYGVIGITIAVVGAIVIRWLARGFPMDREWGDDDA